MELATTETIGPTNCQARFSTPRNYARKSLGPMVVALAIRLGLILMPWQVDVLDVALELDEDGSFHYDEIVLTVPRQSGKTTLILALVVHRLVAIARKLGRQRVTYTAQTRAKARLKLERDFSETLRQADAFTEITHIRNKPTRSTEWKASLNNGSEHILFGAGNYLQIDAPSRTGGHGDTLDVGIIDEAFAHEDDTIEAGMEPSMATRADHQLWVLSTAGDAKSKYLWRKILAGRKACETGEHGRTAYFEWSAPDDADPSDPAVWAACSPALGHTISLRFLEGQWDKAVRGGRKAIDKFRRGYLNQWPEIPELDDEDDDRLIPDETWSALAADHSLAGRIACSYDVSPDLKSGSIALSDGIGVEVADTRQGVSWMPPRLVEICLRNTDIGAVLFDPKGPANAITEDVRKAFADAGIEHLLKEVSQGEHAQACGEFLAAVKFVPGEGEAHRLLHRDQPVLNDAVADADRRPYGDAWAWSRRRSTTDISSLVAVTLARWGTQHFPTHAPLMAFVFGGSS